MVVKCPGLLTRNRHLWIFVAIHFREVVSVNSQISVVYSSSSSKPREVHSFTLNSFRTLSPFLGCRLSRSPTGPVATTIGQESILHRAIAVSYSPCSCGFLHVSTTFSREVSQILFGASCNFWLRICSAATWSRSLNVMLYYPQSIDAVHFPALCWLLRRSV